MQSSKIEQISETYLGYVPNRKKKKQTRIKQIIDTEKKKINK